MPELAASEEHTARVELEIERLRAEAVGQRALRAVAIDSAATQRELLAELEARPLYRAMTKATDIAFVPTAEALLAQETDDLAVDAAAAAVMNACRPIDDVRASGAYRQAMVRVLARRAIEAVLAHLPF